MTLPLVYLSGVPYVQGVQHGKALRERIAHNLDIYYDRFLREAEVGRDEVLRRAGRYAEAIKRQNAAYFAGMQGIAAGSGFDLEEIAALNVRYEILYYHRVVLAQQLPLVDGCTAFAVSPASSSNGNLLLGQNWDWIPEVAGAVLHTRHDTGLESLAFTEAGIFGGKIGFNSAGLGLAVNGITTMGDDWSRLTAPFHVRCHEILLREELQDAREVIAGEVRACSANFLIAQVPDQVIDLEAAPHAIHELTWEDGCLVHTNHFVQPEVIAVQEPEPEYRQYSCRRRERMQALLQAEQSVSISGLMGMLQDHVHSPRSICRHEDVTAPVDEQYRTVTGVIMDLQERVMHISDGPPCENPFVAFQL